MINLNTSWNADEFAYLYINEENVDYIPIWPDKIDKLILFIETIDRTITLTITKNYYKRNENKKISLGFPRLI